MSMAKKYLAHAFAETASLGGGVDGAAQAGRGDRARRRTSLGPCAARALSARLPGRGHAALPALRRALARPGAGPAGAGPGAVRGRGRPGAVGLRQLLSPCRPRLL